LMVLIFALQVPVPAGISANFYRFEEIKKNQDAKSRDLLKNAVSQVVVPRSGTSTSGTPSYMVYLLAIHSTIYYILSIYYFIGDAKLCPLTYISYTAVPCKYNNVVITYLVVPLTNFPKQAAPHSWVAS